MAPHTSTNRAGNADTATQQAVDTAMKQRAAYVQLRQQLVQNALESKVISQKEISEHAAALKSYLDSLDAVLSKGEITGNGWMNILNQDFDLKIGMQSPELGTSKYLQGTTWPLRCEGNLGGSPAKWCGPDKSGFQDIGKQVAAKAAQEKLKDKLGIEGEGDTAEEVIKDAAKKKAREEVDKQLKEGLKKLFN